MALKWRLTQRTVGQVAWARCWVVEVPGFSTGTETRAPGVAPAYPSLP